MPPIPGSPTRSRCRSPCSRASARDARPSSRAPASRTLEGLLYRFPLRYKDRSHPQPISSLRAGSTAALVGTIASCVLRRTRRPGFTLFEAVVRDDSGTIRAIWFNQRFLRDVFEAGQQVALFGKIETRGTGDLQIVNPHYELIDVEPDEEAGPGVHTGRIVPIYERIGTLTPRVQRIAGGAGSSRPAPGSAGSGCRPGSAPIGAGRMSRRRCTTRTSRPTTPTWPR